jgi:hypothetical protein
MQQNSELHFIDAREEGLHLSRRDLDRKLRAASDKGDSHLIQVRFERRNGMGDEKAKQSKIGTVIHICISYMYRTTNRFYLMLPCGPQLQV